MFIRPRDFDVQNWKLNVFALVMTCWTGYTSQKRHEAAEEMKRGCEEA